jgi:APA family basic amino acid/polyamine antiporter
MTWLGVRSGANSASLLTASKLLPLALIIFLGIVHLRHHLEPLHSLDITSPGPGSWLSAVLILMFAFGGSEDALVPAGEVHEPRRSNPFALLSGLFVCMVVCTLVQFVTVTTTGASPTDHPLKVPNA